MPYKASQRHRRARSDFPFRLFSPSVTTIPASSDLRTVKLRFISISAVIKSDSVNDASSYTSARLVTKSSSENRTSGRNLLNHLADFIFLLENHRFITARSSFYKIRIVNISGICFFFNYSSFVLNGCFRYLQIIIIITAKLAINWYGDYSVQCTNACELARWMECCHVSQPTPDAPMWSST